LRPLPKFMLGANAINGWQGLPLSNACDTAGSPLIAPAGIATCGQCG
jgi:hypothetical protein